MLGSKASQIAIGQTWQDLTGSRVLGTTYYNTTAKPILVTAWGSSNVNASGVTTVNAVVVDTFVVNSATAAVPLAKTVIPPGGSYSVSMTGSTLVKWVELR